jgi:hypothetical protein
MTLRSLAALVTLAVPLLACGACGQGVPQDTVAEGQVAQRVTYRRYTVAPPLEVIVVLSTSDSGDGAALRASVSAALRARIQSLADGEAPSFRDVWNPVDVRATVTSAADLATGSPPEPRAFAWREANATREGAAAFAAAVEAAVVAAPAGEAPAGGLVAAMERARAATAPPGPTEQRLVVLVSTSADPNALFPQPLPAREEDTILVVPAASSAGACGSLERAWPAGGIEVLIRPACADLDLETSYSDSAAGCLPLPSGAAPAACAVRALVPRGTPCDPARGWRAPSRRAAPSLDPTLRDLDACEVVELAGDEAAACRKRDRHPAGASGWCLPAPSGSCRVSPPRVLGGAAPPWALLEIACNQGL